MYNDNVEHFFRNVWPNTYDKFHKLTYSGYNLIHYINNYLDDVSNKTILDIGCGKNYFKQIYGNKIIGIDPYHPKNEKNGPDIEIDIDNFNTDNQIFGISLCLGSINFGDYESIKRKLKKIVDLTERYIIFRVNPGIPHEENNKNIYFNWDYDLINHFSDLFNLEIIEGIYEEPVNSRLVWHWKRKGN